MDLKEYFEKTKGFGVLSTSDDKGNLDSVVYPLRPFILKDNTLLLLMENKFYHTNLLSNPKAIFMFFEEGQRYKGKKLYLKKIKEEEEVQAGYSMRKGATSGSVIYRVFFKIEKEEPLMNF